ncbi:hypothetical protein NW759_009034 [Fusarium solani]|nr:hypothetical protein NW759_009034 [Fusarium solani]
MAPIEFDTEEIEALVDIRQKLSPLIAKRIACGSDQVKNLAVLNARDALSFELDQVFLHLRRGQDMSLEDYKQFLRDLQELKLLLEGFIDDQVLAPDHSSGVSIAGLITQDVPNDDWTWTDLQAEKQLSSLGQTQETLDTSEFPRLNALMRRATHEPDGPDLSRFIKLPETNEESRQAEWAVTRFNTNNSKRCAQRDTDCQDAEMDHTTNEQDRWYQPESNLADDQKIAPTSHKPLRTLVTTLTETIEAKCCKHQHVAKIQVQEPIWKTETSEGLDHHLFLSCSSVKDKWQQTTCRPPLKLMKHTCKTIQGCLDDEETLSIFLHQEGIMWDPHSSKPIPSPPVWPTLSLAEMLKSGPSPLSPYDKVILALNLGRMLLRTFDTGMNGCSWSAEDLFFLFESDQETAHQIYNPYLNYSLTSEVTNICPSSPRKFPILIAFAKLLLEIACGKILGPFKRRPDRPDISLLTEVEKDSVTEDVVAAYVHAVKMCLKANKDDDEDAESEEEQCRAVIRDAVADLEGAWRTAYATTRDLNHPKEVKVPRGALKRMAPDVQNGAVRENNSAKVLQEQISVTVLGQTVSSPNGLFDATRLKMLGGCVDSR